MTPSDFRYQERLRVRWAEIDAQKIVFNAHYLMYFDTAIAGYWRALAMPYAETMEHLGGDLFVRKATLEYHGSARYDDLLTIGMRCTRIGTSSMLFQGAAFRQDAALVECELVYVYADPKAQTSRPVPAELRAVLEGYEAGESMVEVRIGGWTDLERDARAIREAVFIQEQRIPADLELDADDPSALHAVAYNRFGLPLATGRLVDIDAKTAKIGRMAVVQAVRGSGVGRTVLEALSQAAGERGVETIVLNAQRSAIDFYRRAGFGAEGERFDEAGIEHQRMTRDATTRPALV